MGTRKTGGASRGANGAGGETIDVAELDDVIDEKLRAYTKGAYDRRTAYYRAKERVQRAKLELAEAEAELELRARPLRKILAALDPAELQRCAAAQPYDGPLKAIAARLTKTRSEQKYDTATRKWKTTKQDTGARPWKELQREGASDAQIAKNIASVGLGRYDHSVGEDEYSLNAKKFTLTRRRRLRDEIVIKSKERLIAEVRRVMQIPEPAAKESGAEGNGKKTAAAAGGKNGASKKAVAKHKAAAKKTVAKGVNGQAAANGQPKTAVATGKAETDAETKGQGPVNRIAEHFASPLGPRSSTAAIHGFGDLGQARDKQFDAPGGAAASNLAAADRAATLGALPAMERRLLEALIAAYPAALAKDEAIARAGYAAGGGKPSRALRRLCDRLYAHERGGRYTASVTFCGGEAGGGVAELEEATP